MRKGRPYIPWTREELDLLTTHYPDGGCRAVQAVMPERSLDSIRGKAEALNLHMTGRCYRQQPATEWIDAAIKRAYQTGRVQVAPLARQLDRSEGWVKWRARELGVATPGAQRTQPRWTAAEDALLMELVGRGHTATVIQTKLKAAGFARPVGGIVNRVTYLEVPWERDFWTVAELARALVVEHRKVTTWIERGQLKAVQGRGPSVDHLPCLERKMLWQIKLKDIRKFLIAHPREWDHRRLSKEVLLDLLLGDEAGMNRGGLGIEAARGLAG